VPKPVQRVSDMDIDEVSLVDRAACPPAAIVFSKRADQEESMPEYSGPDGQPLDLSQFEEGTILEDADGNQFEVTFSDDDGDDDGDEYDDDGAEDYYEDEDELVGAGAAIGKAFADTDDAMLASVREALSKAVTEEDRSAVLSKAFTSLSKRAEQAEAIAKSERDLRLTREYVSKAAEYNVPIAPEELGPVLMRAATALSYEDCAVIHKALSAAGEMLYEEAGFDGSGASEDPMDQIEDFLGQHVSKSGESQELAMTAFFDNNPGVYDALRAERR
jgi:hypothetical protein